ncbi:hypothetical protein FJTKL_03128 [Diaporthe vaccinii]|uniref:Uncharacterized protein n=1 Tax=Diaporthe vaccinii TaxID=105482 RepID=A0ABR4DW19_9PEZI
MPPITLHGDTESEKSGMAVDIIITSIYLSQRKWVYLLFLSASQCAHYPSVIPKSKLGGHDLLHSEFGHQGGTYSRSLYNITSAPSTATPSEPTEPMVAAPAVLEALALAPVAVPVPEDSVVVAVLVADDEPPVVAVVPVPVLVSEPLDDAVELEPEDAAVLLVPVLPALAEEQLSPALMAEQKAWAAGRTSSAVVLTESGLLATCGEHAGGGVARDSVAPHPTEEAPIVRHDWAHSGMDEGHWHQASPAKAVMVVRRDSFMLALFGALVVQME